MNGATAVLRNKRAVLLSAAPFCSDRYRDQSCTTDLDALPD